MEAHWQTHSPLLCSIISPPFCYSFLFRKIFVAGVCVPCVCVLTRQDNCVTSAIVLPINARNTNAMCIGRVFEASSHSIKPCAAVFIVKHVICRISNCATLSFQTPRHLFASHSSLSDCFAVVLPLKPNCTQWNRWWIWNVKIDFKWHSDSPGEHRQYTQSDYRPMYAQANSRIFITFKSKWTRLFPTAVDYLLFSHSLSPVNRQPIRNPESIDYLIFASTTNVWTIFGVRRLINHHRHSIQGSILERLNEIWSLPLVDREQIIAGIVHKWMYCWMPINL